MGAERYGKRVVVAMCRQGRKLGGRVVEAGWQVVVEGMRYVGKKGRGSGSSSVVVVEKGGKGREGVVGIRVGGLWWQEEGGRRRWKGVGL